MKSKPSRFHLSTSPKKRSASRSFLLRQAPLITSIVFTVGGTLPHAGAADLVIAQNAGTSESREITGSSAYDSVYVGYSGTGTLNILQGGYLVNSLDGALGSQEGAHGSAIVSGSWTSSGYLDVGYHGTGSLTIEEGGYVSSSEQITLGYNAASSGTATVSGSMTASDLFVVGSSGTGVLNVEQGGLVTSSSSQILMAYAVGSTATATVSGTLTTAHLMSVGLSGTATLNIEQGGLVTSSSSQIILANGTGSAATATVRGSMTSASYMFIGLSGSAALNIEQGGHVSSMDQINLGRYAGSHGTATVSGSLSVATNLFVGYEGTGTLSIEDGGVVSALDVRLGHLTGTTGVSTLNLKSGGTLVTGSIAKRQGSSTLNLNGGTLRATADADSYLVGFDASGVTLTSNGVTFDTNGYNIGVSTPLSGTGGLTKSGSGTLSLSGSNSYTGATSVTAGTLAVNGQIQGSNLTVQSGATLSGTGVISGTTTIQNGGILAAGNSPGTLTLGTLHLNSGSISNFELGTASDLVAVTGNLTLGGVLNITGITGFTNEPYTLFTYGGELVNQYFTLDLVPTGWNRAQFAIDLSTTGAVKLLVDNTVTIQYWDGSHTAPHSGPAGGSGTWNSASTNWTNSNGSLNTGWQGAVAVFSGSAGTVSVTEDITFAQLQFATTGYTITGDGGSLLASGTAELHTAEGVNAEISATIGEIETASIVKTGSGTLTLSGSNSYQGKTVVRHGTLALSGSGASISTSESNMLVGNTAGDAGTLSIGALATVQNHTGYVGVEANSSGAAIVSGSWVNSGYLYVGNGGNGTLTIEQGGYVTNTIGRIGQVAGASGTATVSGTWINSQELYAGHSGTGTLIIEQGGYIRSGFSVLGNHVGGYGNAIVRGTLENIDGSMHVGNEGDGMLTIEQGGLISGLSGYVGQKATATGTATVSGSWTNTSILYVGFQGAGTLNIEDGGVVTASTVLTGSASSANGAINVNAGGTLITGGITKGSGSAALKLDGGTLRATGSNAAFLSNFGSNDVKLAAGGGIFDTYGYDIGISAALSGSGGLTKIGSGSLVLSHSNSYTGGTTIKEGVLRAENSHALGSGSAVLNSGATLDAATTLEISSFVWNGGGVISLAPQTGYSLTIDGAFTKGTSGVFAFDLDADGVATNTTYTLLTFGSNNGFVLDDFSAPIFFGITPTFSFGDGGTLTIQYAGSTSGSLLQNETPTFTPLDANFIVSGSVATGGLTEDNTVNSLRFENGSSLQVNNQLTVTSGSLTVASGAALLNGDEVYTPGALTKGGAGVLISTADLISAGSTHLQEGAMLINGSLTAANGVTVAHSALLGGSGVIHGSVINQGVMAPGNSPGTLTIVGNYTQAGNGAFQLEVASKNNFDRLIVGGTAILSGVLDVIPYQGHQFEYGQKFTFIESEKLRGAFDTINLPSGLRGRILSRKGDVTLLVAPESYARVAATPNHRNTAKALDAFIGAGGDRDKVSLALDELKSNEYAEAFNQIAPTFYESLAAITIEQSNSQGQMLQQRFGAVRFGGIGSRGFSQNGLALALVADKSGKSVASGKETRDIMEVSEENPWGVWAQGNGIFGKTSGVGDLRNYDTDSGGFLLGADYRWNDSFTTGLYTGYQSVNSRYDGGGKTSINAARFGAYATLDAGNGFYANGLIGGGYSDYTVRRTLEFGALDRTAHSNPNGGEFTAMLGSGYDWKAGGFIFGPVASAQYTYVKINDFTETGARSLNLQLADQEAHSLRSVLGARLAYSWKAKKDVTVTPEIRVSWQHEFLQGSRTLHATLDGGNGPGFNYATTSPSRDSLFTGAGFNLQFGDRWSANVYYNLDCGRGDFESQMLSGGVNLSF